jgi:hypothetical protein
MAKTHLKLVTPSTVQRTVTPKRLPNGKLRTREYLLTEAEVERLMAAAFDGGVGVTNAPINGAFGRPDRHGSAAIRAAWCGRPGTVACYAT